MTKGCYSLLPATFWYPSPLWMSSSVSLIMGELHDRCYKADSQRFGGLNREHICNVVSFGMHFKFFASVSFSVSRMAATGLHAAPERANRYQSHLLQVRYAKHTKTPHRGSSLQITCLKTSLGATATKLVVFKCHDT